MRWIVYGAGAIGGVVGTRLIEAGERVAFVARGAHLEAMRSSGLRVDTPSGSTVFDVTTFDPSSDLAVDADDVVLLAVKSHQTTAALESLASSAPPRTAVVCLQNGVDNERQALRRFSEVYAVCVMSPTSHLEPGVVAAHSMPITGILDIGRYPTGIGERSEELAAAFGRSTFSSRTCTDIMRWKYAKLLANLGNAVEAICGPAARTGPLAAAVRAEGKTCLRAAGIDFASSEEDARRRGDLLTVQPIAGQPRGGGSSWQSLHRGTGSIETDYLNGEIVLLGRLHGVPTPANAAVQRLANQMAEDRSEPGSMSEDEVLERL